MASKYSPYQIIQLLQVSVWRCKATLDYTGFASLSDAIIQYNLSNDHVEIQQNYLNELLLDARKARDSGGQVSKSEQYINAILSYNDCSSWKDFQQEVARCERFLDVAKIDFSKSEKQGISILYDKAESASLTQIITHLQSHTHLAVSARPIEVKENLNLVETFSKYIQEFPFVVWCISDATNDLDFSTFTPELEEYTSSGQVIPVRLSQDLSKRNLTTSFLGKKPISSGLLGFYLSIALIQQDMEVFNDLLEKDELKKSPLNSSRFHVGKNTGTINQFNDVRAGNIVLGGKFVQNTYKKNKK